MISLRMRHESRGRFTVVSRFDGDLAFSKIPIGSIVVAKITQPRSLRELKYFFWLCERAFDNNLTGPSEEDVPTEEHMRAWLLVKVGHYVVDIFEPGAITPPVIDWMKRRNPMTFWRVSESTGRVAAYTAKSISFAELGEAKFNQIVNDVIDVIMSDVVPGTSRKDWEPDRYREAIKANRRPASSPDDQIVDDH